MNWPLYQWPIPFSGCEGIGGGHVDTTVKLESVNQTQAFDGSCYRSWPIPFTRPVTISLGLNLSLMLHELDAESKNVPSSIELIALQAAGTD